MMNVDIWSSLLICLVLVLFSAWLMHLHVRTWRVARQQPGPEPKELDYRRRQFRRRMQTSAMLGLSGIAILVGYFVQQLESHLLIAIFWAGVLFLVVWMGLLALVDMISTRLYFGRLRHGFFIEQTRLHAEMRRIEKIRGKGKGKTGSGGEETRGKGEASGQV